MAKKYESTFTPEEKNFYMEAALAQAQLAFEQGEVPIGCVLVKDKKILSEGFNIRELSQDATTHAEINVIRSANQAEKSFRLENTAIFVTVEPCIMCAGAILLARIPEVYFGSSNGKGGALGTVLDVSDIPQLNHAPYVEKGILEKECGEIMTRFFSEKRKNPQNRMKR